MTEDHIPYAEYAGDPEPEEPAERQRGQVTMRPATPEEEALYGASDYEPRDPNRGIGLIERIFPLRPPQNEEITRVLDTLRIHYTMMARRIADLVPDGPDQTLIIRDLHLNMQKAIMAIVCGEENVALMNAKEREAESR